MVFIRYIISGRSQYWRYLKLLLILVAVCATPKLVKAQIIQNQEATSSGAGLVLGGNYTGYVSAGQIATYMYANSTHVATQGIILNEIAATVEFTFELSGSLTENQNSVVAQMVLKSSKAELAGAALSEVWIYLVQASDSSVFDSTLTSPEGDFVFSNVPYLDFFFMVGSPIITPETPPVLLAFEENPVFIKEVEIYGEVGVGGEIASTQVVLTPQLTSNTEIEEELVFWYRDADGDGFGDANNAVKLNANAQQAGYVVNDADCDDTNASYNPSVVDVPGSGIDANCDGIYIWYKDEDLDTYGGDLLDSTLLDYPLPGQSANNLDCNDQDYFVNPDAIDPPDGSVDANCDGIFGCDGIEILTVNGPVDPIELGNSVQIDVFWQGTNPKETIWDWGGPGVEISNTIIQNVNEASFNYDSAGVYEVSITMIDSCGGIIDTSFKYVVIYDPSGGFVTGSGSIFSPPGASVQFPNATGEATFGFVSKYDKKKGVPKGNTEFEFKAGDLEYVSNEYDWLVISGNKAKFKGRGSVNEEAGFQFLISAIDGDLKSKGDPDIFRIKIWEEESEIVVYDNEIGIGFDEDPITQIMEGSIVIHVPKTAKKSVELLSEQNNFGSEGNSEIRVFPNPTKGQVQIELGGINSSEFDVVVTNLAGQKLIQRTYRSTHRIQLDLSDNTAGIYFVNVIAGDKRKLSKIVLQR